MADLNKRRGYRHRNSVRRGEQGRGDRAHLAGNPNKPGTAVVSAATRLTRPVRNANGGYPSLPGGAPIRIAQEAWTEEAWRQYDLCSELRFATQWLANSIGRCRLTVCEVDAAGVIGPPTKNQEVLGLVAGLLDDPAAQHALLAGLTTNLTIAGDCYILALPSADQAFDEWCVLSTKEISLGLTNEVTINRGDGMPFTVDLDEALVIRVHRPHPRCWWEADSPTRAALPILRELEELSKFLFATINSRLAGAGILALPSEMTFPSPSPEVLTPVDDSFMTTLAEAMLAPIEDMSNPAALVPVVVQAPKDALGGIQWLTSPNSELPTTIETLRDRAIERLMVALDTSSERGQANHWSEWAIEEQSIKFHVEPIMILICNALTEGLLEPSIEAAGLEGIGNFVFWYDPADLINRPNKGTDAKDLYDRDELSGEALRRENGFTENDAPSDSEKQVKTALRIIALAPAYAETLIPHLIDLLGLGSVIDPEDLIPQPSDGTPAQPGTPDPNQDPRAIPEQPAPTPISPRKDGKTPEPNRAA